MGRAACVVACTLMVIVAPSPARAEGGSWAPAPASSSRVADEGPPTVRRWYGYQSMISDVVSTSVFFAGAASINVCISTFGPSHQDCNNDLAGALLLAGTAGYVLGGPVIHAAHGHWDQAGYSLGLRVLPVATALGIGAAIDDPRAGGLLVLGTAVTAMVLDSALLGYETASVERPKASLAPAYDPKSRTGSLVLAGTF